jgi:hypothetical protein
MAFVFLQIERLKVMNRFFSKYRIFIAGRQIAYRLTKVAAYSSLVALSRSSGVSISTPIYCVTAIRIGMPFSR